MSNIIKVKKYETIEWISIDQLLPQEHLYVLLSSKNRENKVEIFIGKKDLNAPSTAFWKNLEGKFVSSFYWAHMPSGVDE